MPKRTETKLTEAQVKRFWEKEIAPYLPEDDPEWKDVPEDEREMIAVWAQEAN